ncbi:MAG: protein kinase [Myxococcota bacterium]
MGRRVLFGSYELLHRIGEGGMAEVWLARSRGIAGFEKTVVLKRVLPSLMARSDFAELLVREAKIAALLNHPNIVHIFELGEEQGAYFIAMEHVHGIDLGRALQLVPNPRDEGGLGLALRLWIAAEAAKALDYAHRRKNEEGTPLQIVHRDVSPANVLLGYEGQVKLSDFGIARADERGLGRDEDPGLIRGKYAYMSPEQARGETLDRRSDLFALGIVLHEMLAGQRLFRGDSPEETLRLVRDAPIPEIDLAALGAPQRLGDVLRRALARDRSVRFEAAGDMAEELGRVLIEMDARVGPSVLSETLCRMVPPAGRGRANKLRADLLDRLDADAQLSGVRVSRPSEATRALPSSRSLRAELRPVVLLVSLDRDTKRERLEAVAERHGGWVLAPVGGLSEVVFGASGAPEGAALAAARTAHALRRDAALGAAVVLAGEAHHYGPGAVEPTLATRERAADALRQLTGPQVVVEPALGPDVRWRFALQEPEAPGAWPTLGSLRAAQERALEALRAGPLIGRRPELKRLALGLARAAEGRGNAVLVVGEAGLGKSRLVAELHGASGDEATFVRVTGRAARPWPLGYGAFGELFADLVGADDTLEIDALRARLARLRHLGLSSRELALVGALHGLGDVPTPRLGRPMGLELVVAARKALHALQSERPVILCLEDVQWMDEASRQTLDLLLAGLRGLRVLAVLTARPGGARPHLHVGEVLYLKELDAASAARLFARRLGARAIDADLHAPLLEETGGVPGWAAHLAAEVRARGAFAEADGLVHRVDWAALPVPAALRANVAATEAHFGPRARRLLRAVAAFDAPVDLSTLAAVEGVPRDVAEAALQPVVSAGLLGEPSMIPQYREPGRWGGGGGAVPVPGRLVVRGGALVRRALRELPDAEDRRALHARIAEVLEKAGAARDERVDALARHAALAGDGARAPGFLVRAGELAEGAGRPAHAAERFVTAAALLERRPDALGEALRLRLRASQLALASDDVEGAGRALEGAAAQFTGPGTLGAELAVARAEVLARQERWGAVVETLASLGDDLDQVADDLLRGHIFVLLGRGLLESGHPGEAVSSLERFAATIEASDAGLSDADVGYAAIGLAIASARLGDLARARAARTDALFLAVRHGGAELRFASLLATAEVAEAEGRTAASAEAWVAAAEVAAEGGRPEARAMSAVRAALACLEAEQEPEAARWAADAVRLARQARSESVGRLAEAVQSTLALLAHPEPLYVQGLVRSVEQLEGQGRFAEAAYALGLLGLAHTVLGDVGAAIRTLGRAAPLARRAGRTPLAERLEARADRLAREGLPRRSSAP